MELPELKRALAERVEDVCAHLLPLGKRDGPEWVVGGLGGEAGKSLKISLRGEKAGVWRDFAGDVGGSNLLELWLQVRSMRFQEALTEAKAWLAQRGVKATERTRQAIRRTYSKPDKKGVTWIANAAEFYLTTDRRIPREIVELYRIAMTEDGEKIVFPYLSEAPPHPAQMLKFLGLKRDADGKKITYTSANTPKVLFGKHTMQPDDRHLLICEGEIDALSWASRKITGLCCTSVPFGAKWEGKDGKDPNDEWIDNDWEWISRFERIYLSFDMDEPGRLACASIIKRLGREVCFVVKLPAKDANELLMADKGDALTAAFTAAQTLDPDSLKNVEAYRQEVLDAMYGANADAAKGIALPFGNQLARIRWHEWTVVTGLSGSGKTQLVDFILLHMWKNGHGSCIASMEVRTARTIQYMVSQATGERLPPKPKAEQALTWLAGGFWLYDRVGRADWREVLATFRYAYRRHGCRLFVIDSWMKLGIDPEDLEEQGEAANAFSNFVDEFPVHLFVVAHPRKPKTDEDVMGKSDIKGSGQITDEAQNVWTVWRNLKKEKTVETQMKNASQDQTILHNLRKGTKDAALIVTKNREEGDLPEVDLWFVKECRQYFGHYRANGMSFLDESVPEAPAQPALPAVQENMDDDQPF